MLRAAVDAALAPVHDRLDELERGMLETIVRVAKAPASTANRSPLAPTREAHDMVRSAVEEALAPLRNRLDELGRGVAETIARVATASASADAAVHDDRAGERERRRIMVVMAGLIVLNVATLLAVLAHGH
jgi:hypothetical protein